MGRRADIISANSFDGHRYVMLGQRATEIPAAANFCGGRQTVFRGRRDANGDWTPDIVKDQLWRRQPQKSDWANGDGTFPNPTGNRDRSANRFKPWSADANGRGRPDLITATITIAPSAYGRQCRAHFKRLQGPAVVARCATLPFLAYLKRDGVEDSIVLDDREKIIYRAA